jgi:hypothetical protein
MAYDKNITITNWTDNTAASNLNFLAPSQFVFTMQRLGAVAFTCQTANIPNISMQASTQVSRLKDTPVPGDRVTFGDLIITFLIDENMTNFKSLADWMTQITADLDTEDYNRYINRQPGYPEAGNKQLKPIAPTMTDATLTITDSNNNANVEIRFKDLFPTSLEALQFDITDTSMPYLTASASFSYSYYDMVKI